MENKTQISVIIVNYNTEELTKNCILSVIENTKKVKCEIIVVDNASTDGSLETLTKLQNKGLIKLIKSKQNLGFAGGNNLAIRKAFGRYILLLNSDTVLENNTIFEVYKWMEKHPDVGISTCSLIGVDGKKQAPGGNFPTLLRAISWMTIEDLPFVDKLIKPFHPKKFNDNYPNEIHWATGTFFFVRQELTEQVGLLDDNYFMYTEEVDYCYRAFKKGWKIYYLPIGKVKHFGKASSSNRFALVQEIKGVKLFYKKHYPKWHYDILRIFLKIGSFLRIVAYFVVGKKQISSTYIDVFNNA